VELEPLRVEKNLARGWIRRIIQPSPNRVEPRCPLFFQPGKTRSAVCGGCDWQHLSLASQHQAKRAILIESFQRLARIPQPAVEPTVGPDASEGAWRYRNKVQIPFARAADGRLTGGFYAPASHTVVPFDDCPVQDERAVRVFHAVRDALADRVVSVYDPANDKGWLRHLLVRTASTGDTLAALVTTEGVVPDGFAARLQRACSFVTSVYHNINDRPGNVVLGPRWKLLGGKPFLEEKLLGLRFRLSPGSFFQIHHAMAEKLYGLAVEMAAAGPQDVVWELYAGVGAMGQLLARRAKLVWAVEESHAAVRDGIESLERNGLTNVRFRQGRCELVLARRLVKDRPSVVILDPPRAGCDPQVLKGVMKAAPNGIVYVSCDPGTLARDARYLSTGGYHLTRSVPVDLFPQTAHIESVSLFRPAGRSDKKTDP
jgi:23S rRNA (uracil1939-C5)-methyltransferase